MSEQEEQLIEKIEIVIESMENDRSACNAVFKNDGKAIVTEHTAVLVLRECLINLNQQGITISRSCETKIITMYRRANELLAFMSAEGEISMRDGDYADNLSDSLFNLDGGTFKNKAETLAALQHTGEKKD